MRRLTIHNRTNDTISFDISSTPEHQISTLPGASTTIPVTSLSSIIRAYGNNTTKEPVSESKESASPGSFAIHAPLKLGASWRVVPVNEVCPWIMYRTRVSHIIDILSYNSNLRLNIDY